MSARANMRPMRVVPEGDTGDRDDEARLVAALRAGTLDAVAGAYDRWHQRVRVLARRLLGDDASAEDVVQEAFAALPGAMRGFRGEVGLEAFLLAIAVKRARHHQRAAWRRRRAMDGLAGQDPGPTRTPEQDAYQRELGQRLTRALDRLPHAQRVAFVLCEIEGMTSIKAARVADAPEPTMRTRLFHARRQLRDLLSREHAE